MITNVVIAKIPITKKGEQKFFQVIIPKDTDRISGIETGITGISLPVGMVANDIAGKQLMGTVKLQAENSANIFYSSELFIGAGQLDTALFGFDGSVPNAAFLNWLATPHAGSAFKDSETLLVKDTAMLYGCYTDAIGKLFNKDITYTAGIYLWTER